MKLKQETRSVKSRALPKKVDFHLLIALVFHDLPRKKMLGAVVKRYMNPTFHDKFQVKKMNLESHGIRTKYVIGVNSIMNTLPIPKIISYN